jgi:hypothetical protein
MCKVTQEFISAAPVASATNMIRGEVKEKRNSFDSVGQVV